MRFVKMQGAGNDFVMLDLVGGLAPPECIRKAAQVLCDRHKGVGADGLILVSKECSGEFRMEMLNPDGSDGGMCGNGVRCAARLLIESGHQPQVTFNLRVGERLVEVEPISSERYRVNMGLALLRRAEIGMLGPGDSTFIGKELCLEGECWKGTAVFMGNPHLVVFCEDVDAIPLASIGPKLENHPLFPSRVNVHFATRLSDDRIKMRTWERGAGLTLACGSGACSVGVAGFLNGLTKRRTSVYVPGGELGIEYLEDGRAMMEGPAERAFEGDYAALLR